MTNRIFISSDQHPMYSWFLPLASLAWQRVAGFRMLAMLVGPVHPWIVGKLEEVGADIVRVSPVQGASSAAVAQFCRLWAWKAPIVKPDDYLMVVDVDAWPCQGAIFQPSGMDIDAIYPAAMAPKLPMGYVGMKADLWRKIIGYEYGSIEDSISDVLATHPGIPPRVQMRTGDPLFNFDEWFLTEKMQASGIYPEKARCVARPGEIPRDRIDRACWPQHVSIEGKIDAHLLRPGWTGDNWIRLRELYAQLVTPADLAWADAYREGWIERHHA